MHIDTEIKAASPPPPGDTVDSRLPLPRLGVLGLQHVLVMYAGSVAVPLIVGHALQLSAQQIGMLISADLFACALATLIQTLGLPGIGIKLPVMMGVTFASVNPMLAIVTAATDAGQPPAAALGTIYGAVIVAGLFGLVAAPLIGRIARYFPSIVTGSIILVIGISLMRVGIEWAAGGRPGSPEYGAPINLLIALVVLAIIMTILRFGRGLLRSAAVLLGVAAGGCIAALAGHTDFSAVGAASWVGFTPPLAFGMPRFELGASVSMCLVMIIVMIESLGMFFAVSEMVGRPATEGMLTRGLRADALGTLLGGVFNTFPYTSFSQNVGLIAMTGIRSRYVCAAGGAIMMILALSPKLAVTIASVPSFVLGGAGLVMFGMIAATGIRILTAVDFTSNSYNLTIVAVSTSVGMIPLVADGFFQHAPAMLQPLLHSGILLTTVSAVGLNLFFNGAGRGAEARAH
ncbi:MAG: nucleobase:cation symporter-2 family protein [Sphingobium sp.]